MIRFYVDGFEHKVIVGIRNVLAAAKLKSVLVYKEHTQLALRFGIDCARKLSGGKTRQTRHGSQVMGLFGSVSSTQVDEFAKNLALELSKRYPPALDAGNERRISQKRLTTILEDTFNRAMEFKKQHRLGVYKKARLGNAFRWALQEMGYSEKFVEVATEGLVVYITKK